VFTPHTRGGVRHGWSWRSVRIWSPGPSASPTSGAGSVSSPDPSPGRGQGLRQGEAVLSGLTGELARQRIVDLHAEADRWRLAGRVRRAAAPWIPWCAGDPGRASRGALPV
jgi:hypothetical protein